MDIYCPPDSCIEKENHIDFIFISVYHILIYEIHKIHKFHKIQNIQNFINFDIFICLY